VHQRRRLIGDRLDQMRMTMAEQVDRDTARKIEVAFATLAEEICAFAAHRPDPASGIDGHQRGD